LFALGAYCTHYHGPLADGPVANDEVRCPWHHACFSLCTGEALRAPALDPIQCWRVEQAGENVFVREKVAPAGPKRALTTAPPSSIIILGGGAAGCAAADMLRREGCSETGGCSSSREQKCALPVGLAIFRADLALLSAQGCGATGRRPGEKRRCGISTQPVALPVQAGKIHNAS
jgi:hypothetical protein